MKRLESSRSAVRARKKKNAISPVDPPLVARRLDRLHDAGGDMSAFMNLSRATRPGRAVQRVNVDFPVDLLRLIDDEAKRIGVTRQAFIKLRLADLVARPPLA